MAKRSEVPVYLQEPEEKEERVKSLDLRQIRTLSGMWDELLYFTQGYELLFFFFFDIEIFEHWRIFRSSWNSRNKILKKVRKHFSAKIQNKPLWC